jgi:hypothetical protein
MAIFREGIAAKGDLKKPIKCFFGEPIDGVTFGI